MIDTEGFKPLPEDLQGWNGTSPIFKKLIDEVKPKTIIEVGSWKGQSTVNMGENSQAEIYCVDTWLGAVEFYTMPGPERDLMKKHGYPQVYYQFLSNIVHHGLEKRVTAIPLPSNLAYHILPKAELIYIDASHSYEDVLVDCNNYWNLLSEGGIIFGDDYTNSVFEVKKAVDEFVFINKLELEIYDNWFWVIRKSGRRKEE